MTSILASAAQLLILVFAHRGWIYIKLCSQEKSAAQVCLFLVTGLLLVVRGCAGVAALYESKKFVWQNDTNFYLLNTLPELMALFIMVWPTLLARCVDFLCPAMLFVITMILGAEWSAHS